jgi:chromosomal replication initiation ATPase DnaA
MRAGSDFRRALSTIQNWKVIPLQKSRVVGDYVRYDSKVNNKLKDLRLSIINNLRRQDDGQNNYLLWGPSGSGKTYFVEEIARTCDWRISFKPLNLAKLEKRGFVNQLSKDDLQRTTPIFTNLRRPRADT